MTLRTAPTPAPRAANPSHDLPSPSPSLSPSPRSGRGEAATREGQPPPPPPYEGNTSPLPPLKRSAFKRGTREITDDDYLNLKKLGRVFPLTGVLVVRGERRPVELLPRSSDDSPRYAVHAPPGRRFESGLSYHECDDTDDVLTWGAVPTEPDDTPELTQRFSVSHRDAIRQVFEIAGEA